MCEKTNPKTCAVILLLLLTAISPAAGKVIYVDANAPGANDGSSWADAYNYLQDALTDANASPKPVEIRVAQGTYRPDEDSLHPDGTGDREATFQLINGLTLKGGYAGSGESDPNARDTDLYETILSGDLDDNDADVNDPSELLTEPSRAENTYGIVSSEWTDATAVLDGFTIIGGHANARDWGVHAHGGGMFLFQSGARIDHCTFAKNSASCAGGAIYNDCGSPALTNCIIRYSAAGDEGGGMFSLESNPVLRHCIFSRNWALYGGGIYNYSASAMRLINCTVTGNSADRGASGIWTDADEEDSETNLELTNCIVWGPDNPYTVDIYITTYGVVVANYSCLGSYTGPLVGIDNIVSEDQPLFADTAADDYHLKSQAGRWDPGSETWVKDDVTSPCIDAGDPMSPIGPEPFPNGGRINMGAYGGTAEASKSYFGEPLCETIVAGDINGDCDINFLDFFFVALHWLEKR